MSRPRSVSGSTSPRGAAALVYLTDPIASPAAVFGLQPRGDGPPYAAFYLDRVDPVTLRVARSSLIRGDPGGLALSSNDTELYVAVKRAAAVLRFAATSLRPERSWPDRYGRLAGPLVSTVGGVWVADTHGVTKFLPQDGSTPFSDPLPRPPQAMANDPDPTGFTSNEFLAIIADTNDCPVVAAGTGPNGLFTPTPARTLARPATCDLGLYNLTGSGAGPAWVTTATGHLGYLIGLTLDPHTAAWGQVRGPGGSNAITASVANGIAFSSDYGKLSCLSADGQVIATQSRPLSEGPVRVVYSSSRYLLVNAEGQLGSAEGPRVQPYTPDPRCHQTPR